MTRMIATAGFLHNHQLVNFVALIILLAAPAAFGKVESRCFGEPENGRLEFGWQLPAAGENFSAYSSFGVLFGRNYLHSQVYRTVLDAYATLEKQMPGKTFVYGETGFRRGGRFWPHKTHQNGLSADFFVPVVDREGRSKPFPAGLLNEFGYGVEFTGGGEYRDLRIDYEAMGNHLTALRHAANLNGVIIRRVIFDNDLRKELFKVAMGLREEMVFSTKKPWVRHDEHYHVDFLVPCEPLNQTAN